MILNSENVPNVHGKICLWNMICESGGKTLFFTNTNIDVSPDLYKQLLYMAFVSIMKDIADVENIKFMKTKTMIQRFSNIYNVSLSPEDIDLLKKVGRYLREHGFSDETISLGTSFVL
jgi:hypothetical protein